MNIYPKGSEWRKWDLHVHVPFTKLNDQYSADNDEEKWNVFCKKIANSDVDAIGVTDYFSIDNYFVFAEKFKKEYPTSTKVFFPNIEFRMDSKNKDNEHIQFHVIFSNEQTVLSKINNFLTRLELVSTDNINLTNKYCIETDLQEIGFNKAMVKIDILEKQLKSDFTESEYLIIGVARGYGSLRPGNNDSRGNEYAKELDKKCKLFFASSKDTDFYLNKISGREQYGLPPKSVISGCDAHSFGDLENKLGKDFKEKNEAGEVILHKEITWIKADPTFEGLKQIIFEPEHRVKIQEQNPSIDFKKPYFNELQIEERALFDNLEDESPIFNKSSIVLNKNLVAIIGGRGTGKSLLLEALGHVYAGPENNTSKEVLDINDGFNVIYIKQDGETEEAFDVSNRKNNNLRYLHINQGDVKSIAETSKKLDFEVKRMLGISEGLPDFSLQEQLESNLDDVLDIIDFLTQKDEHGNILNSKDRFEKDKKNYESLVETLTTKENQEMIEKYTANTAEINKIGYLNKEVVDYKGKITRFLSESSKITDKINLGLSKYDISNIPAVEFNALMEILDNTSSSLEASSTDYNISNLDIREFLKNNKIEGDLESILENIEQYRQKIDSCSKSIEKITEKHTQLEELIKDSKRYSALIRSQIKTKKEEIESKWISLKEKDSLTEEQSELIKMLLKDISIKGNIVFDSSIFVSSIKQHLNLQKFRKTIDKTQEEKILEFFNVENKNDYFKLIRNEEHITIEGEKITLLDLLFLDDYFNGSGKKEFLKVLFQKEERKKYFYTKATILYKNKTPSRLSVGQRGTFYLCMKLATDSFSTPFVFDQPEDDLDNDFIMKELVPIFNKIKNFRQVIIVTHNANLVVNADAEQVIVAFNNEEKLSYKTGSIEGEDQDGHPIKEHICKILEGGDVAFEKRRKRYRH